MSTPTNCPELQSADFIDEVGTNAGAKAIASGTAKA